MTRPPPPLPAPYLNVSRSVLTGCLGLPYCHLGRSRASGFDCVGFLVYYHVVLGLPVNIPPEALSYPQSAWRSGAAQPYLARLEEQFAPVPERATSHGDVILFRMAEGQPINHSGILGDGLEFVHVIEGKGVRRANLGQRFWSARLFGFLRHREMGQLLKRAPLLNRSLRLA